MGRRKGSGNMKKQHRIVSVIAVAFICIAVMPTLFWTFFSFQKIEERIYKEQQVITEYSIRGIDQNLHIYFSEIKKITDSIFGADIVQELLSQQKSKNVSVRDYQNMQAFYGELMGGRTDIARVVLYREDQEIYHSSSYSFAEVYPSDQEFFSKLQEAGGGFVICGNRYYEYINGKQYYVLTVGRQIRNLENGENIGYLLLDIDGKSLHKMIGIDEEDSEELFLICKSDGTVMFNNVSDTDVQSVFEESDSYHIAIDHNGKEFHFVSDYFDWEYVVVRSSREIASGIRQIAEQLVLISMIVCVLILTASIWIAYSLTKPIHQLEDLMLKTGLKGYTEKINIRTPYYELTHLIFCYNKMIGQIQRLMEIQRELMQKQAEAEYQALQMQMTPHFLYNSLDSINCLAEIKNESEISSMIRGLAQIFQYNMEFDKGQVTLLDEIRHVKNYCMLQAVNYQDRFMIDYEIPEELWNQKVVKFMLQPLVENAISHGMREKRNGGSIQISAQQTEQMLEISVVDNGAGMTRQEEECLRKELSDGFRSGDQESGNSHIALNNVNKRLKYQYGKKAGIVFKTKEGEGTIVTVQIPLG